jgi:hypothetical protein
MGEAHLVVDLQNDFRCCGTARLSPAFLPAGLPGQRGAPDPENL